jgi:4'-phosphopantetheinyl transferase
MQPSAPPTVHLDWPKPPPSLRLEDSEVHVWAFVLDVTPETLKALAPILSQTELERAARFHFDTHRNRFVVGRAVLRSLLGRYLQTQPATLEFVYGAHGKPALAGALANSGWQFNLAHSENLALLAVTRGGSIGVDVEYLRALPDADQLVARFFSAREQFAFKRLPAAQKTAAFFNLWTRKEAWLKATGDGIGHLLNQVEVSFLPGAPALLLNLPEPLQHEEASSAAPGFAASYSREVHPPEQPDTTSWSLHHLTPAPGFTGSLALATPASSLNCWCWEEKTSLRTLLA